ncbi:MAG: BrnA antitoxin family protein [Proteobacteria bacterium]|nr:BrnA antitoxin family protein [Pseudomonadota bacterium]
MKSSKDFPFKKSRRISSKEVTSARKAIENKTGKKRKSRGRPAKSGEDKFVPTSIRLHPKILLWAKREAKKRGCGYQTVINEILLEKAA